MLTHTLLNHIFELFVLVPFIGLLWMGFLTICYVFIQILKGNF